MITKDKIYKNLINGQFYEIKHNNYIEIKSPIDESLIGKVQALTKEDVNYVFKVAKDAQIKWKSTPLNQRAKIFYKAADLLLNKKEELAEMLIREIAKDKKSALSEIERTADFIRVTADIAIGIDGKNINADAFPGAEKDKIALTNREPLGVILAISPFNYPINLSASKIAPALITGNSVVLKPATQGSISALCLVEIFHKAGLDNGVLNTITGKGSEIGDFCVTHKSVDFINFTGSTEIGKRISKLTEMKPLLMELGGKDTAIVLEDADLELAAKNIVEGAYSYSGQRCTAIKRVLVIEKIADELVEKLKNRIRNLRVGNPLVNEVDIVPLIDNKAADFVISLIDDAKEKGAKLLVGGHRKSNLIEPTLFDKVSLDMRLAWEEPFGPVLPIIRVSNKEQALEIANKSTYGLQSSVFTNDINSAFYIANNLNVGTIQINNKTERGPDHFPFLGVKDSGMGTQGILNSIEAMTRIKVIVIKLMNINKE